MKFYKRILLTIPFIITTLVYCYFNDPDDVCHGLADLITNLFFYALFIFTILVAIIAALKGRQIEKFRLEPITLSIIILTISMLGYNSIFRGHTKGDKLLVAINEASGIMNEKQELTLRKNGNFTITLSSTDFSCSVSGIYSHIGDTISFDKSMVEKAASRLTTTYLIQSKKIVPIKDTIEKVVFNIISKR